MLVDGASMAPHGAGPPHGEWRCTATTKSHSYALAGSTDKIMKEIKERAAEGVSGGKS